MYKNIVFKGGGVLGIAYVGALKVLSEKGLLNSVERIAGTSAGAIFATLLTVGYSPDELDDIMSGLNFKSFEDGNLIGEVEGVLSSRHGLHRGKFFEQWIEKLIFDKTKVPFSTFKDLHDLSYPTLSTVTTYLNEGDVIICNYQSTPDVIVSEAVRASMSIPLFFDRFIFTKGFNSTQAFVDGGEILNYPISLFNGYPDEDTIGLFLHDIQNVQPPLIIDSMVDFAKANFEATLASGNAEFFNNSKYVKQTILIDSLGISATNFGLSDADKLKLYNSGTDAANKYFLNKQYIW
jgi:NTE family protein